MTMNIKNIAVKGKIRFEPTAQNQDNLDARRIIALKGKLLALVRLDPIKAKEVNKSLVKILNTIQYRLNADGGIYDTHNQGIFEKLEKLNESNNLGYTNNELRQLHETFIYYAQHKDHTWFGNCRINFFNYISRSTSMTNILNYLVQPEDITHDRYKGIDLEKKRIDEIVKTSLTKENVYKLINSQLISLEQLGQWLTNEVILKDVFVEEYKKTNNLHKFSSEFQILTEIDYKALKDQLIEWGKPFDLSPHKCSRKTHQVRPL